mmetsp:Transcript_26381/g.62623  ORF Transcript_26381/g.62623 Transcript_26381/m.62623 type:complete len:422 (+) Transcript_26381:1020-2285(+)
MAQKRNDFRRRSIAHLVVEPNEYNGRWCDIIGSIEKSRPSPSKTGQDRRRVVFLPGLVERGGQPCRKPPPEPSFYLLAVAVKAVIADAAPSLHFPVFRPRVDGIYLHLAGLAFGHGFQSLDERRPLLAAAPVPNAPRPHHVVTPPYSPPEEPEQRVHVPVRARVGHEPLTPRKHHQPAQRDDRVLVQAPRRVGTVHDAERECRAPSLPTLLVTGQAGDLLPHAVRRVRRDVDLVVAALVCQPREVAVQRNSIVRHDERVPLLRPPAVLPVLPEERRHVLCHLRAEAEEPAPRQEAARVVQYLFAVRHRRQDCRLVGPRAEPRGPPERGRDGLARRPVGHVGRQRGEVGLGGVAVDHQHVLGRLAAQHRRDGSGPRPGLPVVVAERPGAGHGTTPRELVGVVDQRGQAGLSLTGRRRSRRPG